MLSSTSPSHQDDPLPHASRYVPNTRQHGRIAKDMAVVVSFLGCPESPFLPPLRSRTTVVLSARGRWSGLDACSSMTAHPSDSQALVTSPPPSSNLLFFSRPLSTSSQPWRALARRHPTLSPGIHLSLHSMRILSPLKHFFSLVGAGPR